MRSTRSRAGIYAVLGASILIIILAVTYIAAGVALRIDAPIIRNIVEPVSLPSASYDAFLVVQSWNPTIGLNDTGYKPMFSPEETEDDFFERMKDIDAWRGNTTASRQYSVVR